MIGPAKSLPIQIIITHNRVAIFVTIHAAVSAVLAGATGTSPRKFSFSNFTIGALTPFHFYLLKCYTQAM